MHADEQAIRDLVARWLAASNTGDHETLLQLMADDVVFLATGQPPMHGKAGFTAAQKNIAACRIEASGDIQEIRTFGDWAYCWNRLVVVMTPHGGGEPVTRTGDVLSILQKQNGRWVIARDANLLTVTK